MSRRFKAATEAALDELMHRDLAELSVAALLTDGIIFAEVCCVVALAITADGTKVPIGLWQGGDAHEHELHREHDLGRARHDRQREALARRQDDQPVVRRRHAQRRTQLP